MTTPKFTAHDMHRALWRHFCERWAVLTEVTARAEYAPPPAPVEEGVLMPRPARPMQVSSQRRIDVLLLRGGGPKADGYIERIAIEIKVARSDFLADVRQPDKQAPWRGLAHRHAYAVPEGLVAETEVPAGSGLLVVRRVDWAGGFTVRWARQAKKPAGHRPGPLPLAIQLDAFYRAGRGWASLKGHDTNTAGDLGDDPDQLRAEVQRLRHENGLLSGRIDREVELKQRWQAAYAAQGSPPCATCGRPLNLARALYRGAVAWEHDDPADKAACELLRRAEATRENNERPEERRIEEKYLHVPGPWPAELAAVTG